MDDEGGLGTASRADGPLVVGAIVAVNCFGDVVDPAIRITAAGILNEASNGFASYLKQPGKTRFAINSRAISQGSTLISRLHAVGYHVRSLRYSVFLPFHHGDPSDRLIAAQALVERISILPTDGIMPEHGVNNLF